MAKHDRAKREKAARNEKYALRYRLRTCENCGHKSSAKEKCKICRGKMKAKRIS